jgi:hypothetical protein
VHVGRRILGDGDGLVALARSVIVAHDLAHHIQGRDALVVLLEGRLLGLLRPGTLGPTRAIASSTGSHRLISVDLF